MSAGLPRSERTSVAARRATCALLAALAAVLAGPISAHAGPADSTRIAAAAESGRHAIAATEKRCKTVRVKLRRHGKVVKRHGKPVFRRVRRCKKVPGPGCRFVKVKKRKNGKVVMRRGKPVYIKVERCPPNSGPPAPGSAPGPGPTTGPAPSPGPGPGPAPQAGLAEELANRVMALDPRVPGNLDLFSSVFQPSGSDGLAGLKESSQHRVSVSGR